MARRARLQLTGGVDDMIRQLDAFSRNLPRFATEELDRVLKQAEESSAAMAHTHARGALKASIRSSSEYYPQSATWSGRVETDDRAAIFELQRGPTIPPDETTGHSDFIDKLTPLYADALGDACDRAMDRAMGLG